MSQNCLERKSIKPPSPKPRRKRATLREAIPVCDRPSLVIRLKTHAATPAGAQPDSLPSCETKAVDSSTQALFALAEPLVIEVAKMLEAKQDLSPEVTPELTSKVGCDLVAGIRPDLKPEVNPESESSVDSTLDVEPVVAVEAQLLIVLAETEVKCGPVRSDHSGHQSKPYLRD